MEGRSHRCRVGPGDGPGAPESGRDAGGFSLIEAVVVAALLGLALLLVVPRAPLDALALSRAARVAESQLVRARLHAVAGRDRIHVVASGTRLELRSPASGLLSGIDLADAALGRLDSVRLRPATLRFNARGQGSAGSLYLYRSGRGMRLVCNFLGRVRRAPFRY